MLLMIRNCESYKINKKKLILFSALNSTQEREDGGVGELVLHDLFGLVIDRPENLLDVFANRTFWVRGLTVHRERRPFLYGTANVPERQFAGFLCQLPSAAISRLRGNDADFAKGSEQPPHDDRVGVHAAGNVFRRERLAGTRSEKREDMQCHRESCADVHL